MVYLSRLRLPLVLLVLMLISACALPPLRQIDLSQFRLPMLRLQQLVTTNNRLLDDFTTQLAAALEQHDYAQLQNLMGDSFVLADGYAKGRSLPSQVALVQLRNHYLLPSSAIAFSTTVVSEDMWRNLFEGSDGLALGDFSLGTVKALYATGLSANQRGEALLLLAQQPNGTPYWHSMVVAPDGFQPKLANGAVITTHRTATEPRGQSAPPQVISPAPGAATAKVSGVLYPGQRNYLVRALAGQRLAVSVASPNGQADLTIRSHDKRKELQEIAKGLRTWTATVPTTQDYLVSVNTNAATPFELITTVE